jgi:hypothetical protein
METNENFRGIAKSNIVLKLLLTLIIIFNVSLLKSQESLLKFYPAFGISVGFFNPKDVNNYIKNDLSSNYHYFRYVCLL